MIDATQSAIQSMLSQIRQYEARAKSVDAPAESEQTSAKPFAKVVQQAIKSVDDLQQNAKVLAEDYERGKDVPLTDVVLSMQKASIAFEATLQIRNKVIKAYEDIKNMPV
jgi:flagellar hook-basal body complex protein FliE